MASEIVFPLVVRDGRTAALLPLSTMLVPPPEIGGVESPDQPLEAPLRCPGVTQFNMTDTQLTVQCEGNVTCTALDLQPGATIVSPILLSLSGVAGQIWALYYLYTSTRPQQSRTVFFVLLSTLIWTDLIGKIITTPPALIAYVHHGWKGGVELCNFHAFSMMLISLVTHLLVSTMAVERFIGIRHGYFYNKNITTSRTKMLLLCIWLFSVLFCAMPLFGWGQYALQYPGSWCFVNIHVCGDTPLHHLIYTNIFGTFTIINLFVMVICNVVVIILLLQKTLTRNDNYFEATLLCLRLCRHRCATTKFCAPHRTSKQRELEMQMAIVLLVITIVFVLSWSPFDLRLFLNQIWPHRTREDHLKDLIAVRLTSINQIIDPWAYIICRKLFSSRVWRWVRMPLLGRSWLLRRESSSVLQVGGGSRKKVSRTVTHAEKKIEYKTPYQAAEDVVVVVEEDPSGRGCISSPPAPPPSKTSQGDDLGSKDMVEIFKDSGTGSNNTPSTLCSDSGTGNCNLTYHERREEEGNMTIVPIPVFTSQQYRVVTPTSAARHTHRVRRICSSASARTASVTRPHAHPQNAQDMSSGSSPSNVVTGRRHSWCCPQDGLDAKQYRTQSTQTFKALSKNDDSSDLSPHQQYDPHEPHHLNDHEHCHHNDLGGHSHEGCVTTRGDGRRPRVPDDYPVLSPHDLPERYIPRAAGDYVIDFDEDPVFIVASAVSHLSHLGEGERAKGESAFPFPCPATSPALPPRHTEAERQRRHTGDSPHKQSSSAATRW
ncbi:prostaglandin E2 receptor EP4 subtype-like isoform X2 [Penaeus japonicus]|uniref:prostaglandin E2 receptor EP4 subtype-like isoform X2 n=1 Tax=Penaeus japonicus TaxID=27405 RepID=UPI001C710F0A|nr:prostaglandin E2 receptor EP4 subtype-like isoform X2 [Penaeus japonicus]